MSDLALRMPGMGGLPDPWRRLAEDWPEVVVRHVDLGHRWEITRWFADGSIVIDLHHQLTQVQRRAALAHALEHVDCGMPCASLRATTEGRVVAATARWLLPDLDVLRKVLSTYDNLHNAAHELWVPFKVLVDRLNGLTEAESAYLHGIEEEAIA